MMAQQVKVAVPGMVLQTSNLFEAGIGSYERGGKIISSIVGNVEIEAGDKSKPKIRVVPTKSHVETGIAIGDIVICKVLRIMSAQVTVEIDYLGDRELRQPAQAIIRKEDTRLGDIDKVVMFECFRPGDLVRAVVISLGDSRQYFLSTAAVELGVIIARHESSGRIMAPVSWKVSPLLYFNSNSHYRSI